MLAGKGWSFVAQHWENDLQRFLELLEAFGDRSEFETERIMFKFEPSGTNSELRPTTRNDVKGGDRLRKKCRVSVGVAGDQRGLGPKVLGFPAEWFWALMISHCSTTQLANFLMKQSLSVGTLTMPRVLVWLRQHRGFWKVLSRRFCVLLPANSL